MASWLALRPSSRQLHSLACGVPANHTLEDMLEDMQTETAPYAVGHAILMVTATCVLMPLGILLARKKSKWHPVMQTVATLLLIIGWVVIRQSEEEPSEPCPAGSKPAHSYAGAIHGTLGKLLVVAILLQGCLGFAIKLLRRLPTLSLVKRLFSAIHRCAAWGVVPAAWLIAIGGLVHFAAMAKPLTAQTMGHMVPGSHVLLLAVLVHSWAAGLVTKRRLAIMANVWALSAGVVIILWQQPDDSQEWHYLSWSEWPMQDQEHQALGITLFIGSLVGAWLLFGSRSEGRTLAATHISFLILLVVGWAMGDHSQHTEFQTKVHTCFGIAIVVAVASGMLAMHIPHTKPARLVGRLCSLWIMMSALLFLSQAAPLPATVIGTLHVSTYVLFVTCVAAVMHTSMDVVMEAARIGLEGGHGGEEDAYQPVATARPHGGGGSGGGGGMGVAGGRGQVGEEGDVELALADGRPRGRTRSDSLGIDAVPASDAEGGEDGASED